MAFQSDLHTVYPSLHTRASRLAWLAGSLRLGLFGCWKSATELQHVCGPFLQLMTSIRTDEFARHVCRKVVLKTRKRSEFIYQRGWTTSEGEISAVIFSLYFSCLFTMIIRSVYALSFEDRTSMVSHLLESKSLFSSKDTPLLVINEKKKRRIHELLARREVLDNFLQLKFLNLKRVNTFLTPP